MNGAYQETPGTWRSIPEEHKQQIIVVLGQMIEHCLRATGTRGRSQTRKGPEPSAMMRHEVIELKRTSGMEAQG
jgi:hypothetical protein